MATWRRAIAVATGWQPGSRRFERSAAGIFKAAYSWPKSSLISEIFPTQMCSTGLSIGYSIGVTIFGGFAPMIMETFIHLTGDKLAPNCYVLIAAALSGKSLVVAWRMRRVQHVDRIQHA
ncbi:hypothetical protein [Paraburkholderia sp. SIMBA_030]|uniref:hypothetical protein n=1 Tax=Paraburkholderia sp. SIMBA_030 TaxID=3085773 RepID=UPI00397B4586